MLTSFRHFIQKCVHEKEDAKFHNRIDKKKINELFFKIFHRFQDWNTKSFQQIKKENRNFRKLNHKEKIEIFKAFAHYGDKYKLETLLLDFEHASYPRKEDKVENENLFCVMKGVKNCESEISTLKIPE